MISYNYIYHTTKKDVPWNKKSLIEFVEYVNEEVIIGNRANFRSRKHLVDQYTLTEDEKKKKI